MGPGPRGRGGRAARRRSLSGGRPPPVLVAATDDALLARPDFPARLEALLEAGLPALLLRGKRVTGRELYKHSCEARRRCSARGAELWVGDRADVARAAGADGVQLPEAGLSIAGARRASGTGVRIGRSVHSAEAAVRAIEEGADHLVVGSIYTTPSHPGVRPVGPALLREIRAAATVPLLAVGGITPGRVGGVVEAGAAGAVAIRALWEAPDPTAAVREMLAAFGADTDER